MDKSFNIIISAFIAIGIYLLIILAFILYLSNTSVKKYTSIKKDTIIELDLIIQKKEEINKDKQLKNHIVKNDIKVKKSSSVSANKKTNLKSLYAKISTKSTLVKTKKVLNIKNNKVASRFKSSFKKNIEKNQLKISKLKKIKANKTVKKIVSKNDGNFDEYYSKINTHIITRWYKYPLFVNEEYLIKVQINISAKGVFSYNVISHSGKLNIDNAVKEFLKTQENKIYPIPFDKKQKNIIINFINDKNN